MFGSVPYSGGQAKAGHVHSAPEDLLTGVNAAPLRAQQQTITIADAVPTSYSHLVTRSDGSTATLLYTPTASATTATLRAAEFKTLVNGHAEWSALWTATSAAGVVTLVTKKKGIRHNIGSATGATRAESVTPLSPSALRPGRVVVRASGLAAASQGQDVIGALNSPAVKHPALADFAVMTATITIASIIAGEIVTVYMETERGSFEVSQEFATDNATTATRLNAKLDAKLEALYGSGTGFSSTETGAVITVVTDATEKGAWFSIRTNVSGAAATTGTAVVAYTAAESSSTSLRRAVFGVSSRDGATYDDDVQAETLAVSRPVLALARGQIFVTSEEAISAGADVYVGTASGEEGLLYAAFATGRRKIAGLSWVSDEPTSNLQPANNVALVRAAL